MSFTTTPHQSLKENFHGYIEGWKGCFSFRLELFPIDEVKKSKSFATPGQFECAMDDRQIDEKRKTMMAFFTSQTTTIPFDQNSHKFGSKATRKISQPAMHIHAGGSGDSILRNTEHVRGRNTKRSSVTSISDEILGDEDLRDVDAVFESLLTSTFSENESSSSISGPKSGYNL